MAWTCPHCEKTFAKDKQSHICVKIDPHFLFEGKAPQLPALYEQVLETLREFCEFQVTTSTKSITLYGKAHRSFMVMKPKKQWIDLWFSLEREVDEFPVYKVHAHTKTRFVHYIRLEEEEDIQSVIFDWIAEAYVLTNPDKKS